MCLPKVDMVWRAFIFWHVSVRKGKGFFIFIFILSIQALFFIINIVFSSSGIKNRELLHTVYRAIICILCKKEGNTYMFRKQEKKLIIVCLVAAVAVLYAVVKSIIRIMSY